DGHDGAAGGKTRAHAPLVPVLPLLLLPAHSGVRFHIEEPSGRRCPAGRAAALARFARDPRPLDRGDPLALPRRPPRGRPGAAEPPPPLARLLRIVLRLRIRPACAPRDARRPRELPPLDARGSLPPLSPDALALAPR